MKAETKKTLTGLGIVIALIAGYFIYKSTVEAEEGVQAKITEAKLTKGGEQ